MAQRNIVGPLVLTLLGLSAAQATAAAPPSHIEMALVTTMGNFKLGEGREVLEHDGKCYNIVSLSVPKGLAALFINDVRRESRGAVTASGLKPEQFEETGRKGGTRTARFDWASGKITLASHDSTRTVELPPNTLDQTSFPYSFAFSAAVRKVFDVHLTDGQGVKQYQYRQVGKETLKTPLGEIETLHFEKVRDPNDKRGFEFWLAVDRHFLPVKLRYIEKNGDTFESLVTGIEIR